MCLGKLIYDEQSREEYIKRIEDENRALKSIIRSLFNQIKIIDDKIDFVECWGSKK